VLRLTLVTETFHPEVNGVARTLGRWVDTFRNRGHLVHILRPRQPHEPAGPGLVHGMPLPFYPQVRVGVASPLRLAGLLAVQRPDLIHVATEGPLGWAALVAAATLGVPVASSFHTNFDQYLAHYSLGGLERLASAYLRWFHNHTAVTLVPTESTQRRLLADGFQRVEVWSRGVDAEHFHPRQRDEALRRRLALKPEDVLLLYVGRLAYEKNLPALMAAFARLRRQTAGQRVLLGLVGDGPLAAGLRSQQPPDVVFAGEQHGQALARWYASADVFAFPSLSETFGNVVLEAQASGLPVAAFEGPALAERVTPEVDGLLVPPDGDLAVALARLCADRTLRQAWGQTARAKAVRQGWGAIFDVLERRYCDIVAQHRTTGMGNNGQGPGKEKGMIHVPGGPGPPGGVVAPEGSGVYTPAY
jgi:glycosyltransferase involved in cell wall biosynthesis